LTDSYFVETVKKFIEQNSKVYAAGKVTNLKINTCLETIFILPVPEDEVEMVIQHLNGTFGRYQRTRLDCKEMYEIYRETHN